MRKRGRDGRGDMFEGGRWWSGMVRVGRSEGWRELTGWLAEGVPERGDKLDSGGINGTRD